jgi:hypothetical protein
MKKQNKNIDFLIRRVLTIGLFLFVLCLFKNKDCSSVNSYNQGTTIEYASVNKSVVLVEPFSLPNFENSLVFCDLFAFNNSNKENFKIIYSNNKTNQSFLFCKELFIKIKPQIPNLKLHHIRTSLNTEEISLIS